MVAKKTKVTLADANRDDLFVFVTTHLGIDVKDGATRGELYAKALESGLKAESKIDAVSVPDAIRPGSTQEIRRPIERDTAGNPVEASADDAEDLDEAEVEAALEAHMNEFCVINIAVSELPGGETPVYASVNGKAIWLPRGEPIKVRRMYVEALEHAVADHFAESMAGLGDARKVQTYPFQILHDRVAA